MLSQIDSNMNFQGKLIVKGVKLPKKKLSAVSTAYGSSKDLPDVHIVGFRVNKEGADGRFINYVNIETADLSHPDSVSIPYSTIGKFKELFNSLSPKALAKVFKNIAKRNKLEDETIQIQRRIANIEKSMKSAKALGCDAVFMSLSRSKMKLSADVEKNMTQIDNIKINDALSL